MPLSDSVHLPFLTMLKAWSVLAGVCGSLVPILIFSDKRKTTFKQALFMAIIGCSFSTFMGPWIADRFSLTGPDAIIALSWFLGVIGVYIIRAGLHWIERRGDHIFDNLFGKLTGHSGKPKDSTSDGGQS